MGGGASRVDAYAATPLVTLPGDAGSGGAVDEGALAAALKVFKGIAAPGARAATLRAVMAHFERELPAARAPASGMTSCGVGSAHDVADSRGSSSSALRRPRRDSRRPSRLRLSEVRGARARAGSRRAQFSCRRARCVRVRVWSGRTRRGWAAGRRRAPGCL